MNKLSDSSHNNFTPVGMKSDQADLGYQVTADWKDAAILRGDGYAADFANTPTGGATPFYYLKNTHPTRDLVISRLRLLCAAAEKVVLMVGRTGTAAGTDAVPANLRAGSANTAPVVSKQSNAITGTAAGTEAGTISLAAGVPGDFGDTLVIPPGQSLTLMSTTGGNALTASIRMVLN